LGKGPASGDPSPPTRLSEQDCGEYQLVEYEYTNGLGERVPLSVAEPRERRFPRAVIAIHQTNETGRREVFGLVGDPTLDYGRRLACRGHRVFAIDLSWTGERAPERQWDKDGFYSAYPRWSMVGKDVRDVRDLCRVIHEHFSEAPPYGCIGHSHGGVVGYFYAALHDEISNLACNAAYVPVPPSGDPWEGQLYATRTLNPEVRGLCVASNMDLVMSLAAVRANVLLIYYREDQILIPSCPSDAEVRRMSTFSPRVTRVELPGGHAFPEPAQDRCFDFLEEAPFTG
jgi:pimeloyl-ACP methyl ester carboxylesterase